MLYLAAILARNPIPASLATLAQELDAAWVELGRFFVNRKFLAQLNAGVASELSPVQLRAVTLLFGEPMRVGQLAERIGLAESSVTRMADRLGRLGLVERQPEPGDRRSVMLRLSPAGRRVGQSIARARRAFLTDMLEALEPSEQHELVRLFGAIVETWSRNEPDASRRVS
jgi:DNA-binding MarR family transcriptional regulator